MGLNSPEHVSVDVARERQGKLRRRRRFTLSFLLLALAIDVVNNIFLRAGLISEDLSQSISGVALIVGGIGVVGFLSGEFRIRTTPAVFMTFAFLSLAVEVVARVLAELEIWQSVPFLVANSSAFEFLMTITESATLGGLFVGLVTALTSTRIASLDLAVSREELATELAEREEADRALRMLVASTSKLTGQAFFEALVDYLSEVLDTRMAFIAAYHPARGQEEIQCIAVRSAGKPIEPFACTVAGTPCKSVLEDSEPRLYESDLQELFPEDEFLKDIDAESYLGIPVVGHSGSVLGHIVIMDDRPMVRNERRERIIQLFAERAAAEFERLEFEQSLRDQTQVIEAADDAITTVDLEGRIVSWNSGAERIYGYTADEIMGEHLDRLFAEDPDAETKRFEETIGSGKTVNGLITPRRTKYGRTIWVSLSTFPLHNPDGSIRAFSGIARDVTEQIEADRALQESEARLRTFFNHVPNLVRVLDPDGVVKYANRPDSLSPPVEMVVGRRLTELLGEDQHEAAEAAFECAKHTREPVTTTIYSDNVDRTFHVQLVPICNESGEVYEVLIVGTDVSEQMARERATREAEEKYRFLAERMQDIIWSVDADLKYTYISPSVEAVTGYTPEEALGQPLSVNVSERDMEKVRKYTKGAEDGAGSEISFEQAVMHKDGHEVVLDISAVAVRDESGRVLGFQGISRDITERRRAEELLREKEEQYRLIVETSHEGILLLNNENRIIFVNRRMAEMTGFAQNEMVGRDIGDFVFEDDLKLGVTMLQQIRSGKSNQVEFRLKNQTGHELWVDASTSLLRSESGEVRGMLALMTDITERRADAEARRELEAQVQHAQKLESLGVLAGGIAHDFNNLLAGIMGYASLLSQDMADGGPAKGYVEKIELASARAAELTKQMLAYSGKGKYVLEEINLSKLTGEMLDLIHASISKKARVMFELSDEIPPVRVDSGQISQVIMNLVINASDALDGEAGEIVVRTFETELADADVPLNVLRSPVTPGRYAVLEVSDTGCGMSSDTVARIFDPFFTTKFTGRGLGLAAVQGIVRGHGGAITVDSDPGGGTIIRVLLPVAKSAGTDGVSRVVPERAANESGLNGCVLVVDDDPVIRTLAGDVLSRLGMEVESAANGREAVTLFNEDPGRFSVVLLDYTMPEMNGRETMEALRRVRGDIPIVMSSGYSQQDALEEVTDWRTQFVQKPYPMHELISAVRAAIDASAGPVPAQK